MLGSVKLRGAHQRQAAAAPSRRGLHGQGAKQTVRLVQLETDDALWILEVAAAKAVGGIETVQIVDRQIDGAQQSLERRTFDTDSNHLEPPVLAPSMRSASWRLTLASAPSCPFR